MRSFDSERILQGLAIDAVQLNGHVPDIGLGSGSLGRSPRQTPGEKTAKTQEICCELPTHPTGLL